MKTEVMRVEDRELNLARSNPDSVNRHVRTARTIVHHYHCIMPSWSSLPTELSSGWPCALQGPKFKIPISRSC